MSFLLNWSQTFLIFIHSSQSCGFIRSNTWMSVQLVSWIFQTVLPLHHITFQTEYLLSCLQKWIGLHSSLPLENISFQLKYNPSCYSSHIAFILFRFWANKLYITLSKKLLVCIPQNFHQLS